MSLSSLVRFLSNILMGIGGILFLFGDRALREFWHVKFVLAELSGICGGVLLMLLGSALKFSLSKNGRKVKS